MDHPIKPNWNSLQNIKRGLKLSHTIFFPHNCRRLIQWFFDTISTKMVLWIGLLSIVRGVGKWNTFYAQSSVKKGLLCLMQNNKKTVHGIL